MASLWIPQSLRNVLKMKNSWNVSKSELRIKQIGIASMNTMQYIAFSGTRIF